MTLLLLIFGVLYGLLRGFGEGMVMYFPNVRDHFAFYAYHLAGLLEPLALIAATVSWGLSNASKRYIAGTLVLMWEAFEIAYLVTRSGQVEISHENIMGFFAVDSLFIVLSVHAARLLLGFGLVLSGRK